MGRFQITHRQALLLFLICTVSSKMQMLPCLLSGYAKSDLWIILLFGALIDALFFALTIFINKLCPNQTIHDLLRNTFGKFVSAIVGILFLLYFLATALLPYEAVRAVFANNLFDTIPWQLFSLFLLFAVGYLAFCGMRTIGRTAELYFPLILLSVVGLGLLGILSTKITNVLPVGTVGATTLTKTYFAHSLWFADYMIFYVLIGRIKPSDGGLKFKDLFAYGACMIFYVICYAVFYGLYTVQSSTQTSLLSSISALSITNLDIGRVDWFLVLFSQAASVISCATYTYCAVDCINQITGKKHYGFCVIIVILLLYFADVTLFGNIDSGINLYTKFTGYFSFGLQTLVPLICLFSAIIWHKKERKNSKKLAIINKK